MNWPIKCTSLDIDEIPSKVLQGERISNQQNTASETPMRRLKPGQKVYPKEEHRKICKETRTEPIRLHYCFLNFAGNCLMIPWLSKSANMSI